MLTEHTPGPWSRNIPPARKYPTVFAGRNTHIAVVRERPSDDETEANCDLIAAAPDLLAALMLVRDKVKLPLVIETVVNDALAMALPCARMNAAQKALQNHENRFE